MKNTFGNNITVTIFGESHGPAIGLPESKLIPALSKNSWTSGNQRERFLQHVSRVTGFKL